ncbi:MULTISPECIES: DUF1127 domain-containing protein [Serratia]|uniref:YjiS-like domain-containing protein n=1 Tax=Serratia oryzae TaxID=2034155 RepID=A0A1S8CN96_9GAMM|nr:DUF1127 domain-containing protein [Serratia oryzae]OMQ25700.1 hypothetical protein BMI79_05200 [Serratia oryzae]VXC62124.1 conserved hypothetical protein [Enterobacterales bacterium 8AC]
MMTISAERQPVQHKALWRWLQSCLQRQQTRRALLLLSDDQLADIGLSRAQAKREGYKPFWRE